MQPTWKRMKADDNGLAHGAYPSSSTFIHFQAVYTHSLPPFSSGAYLPYFMRYRQRHLYNAGGARSTTVENFWGSGFSWVYGVWEGKASRFCRDLRDATDLETDVNGLAHGNFLKT
eukprot:gene3575-14170_t